MTEPLPLRFSQLKQFARSPAHYLEARANELAQTSAMEKGSALHAVVLGTHTVSPYPGAQRRGKEWEAFKAQHEGELIVTADAYEKVMGMAEAIWSEPLAKEVLFTSSSVIEQTMLFELHGKKCRGTPDVRTPSYVVDLKTSSTTEPERLMRHAQNMLYHAQLAFYLQGMAASGYGTHREAFLVAVEAVAPHPVVVLHLTDQAIEMGDRSIRLWFERLLSCEQADYFPGYTQSRVTWDIEEELELQFAEEPADTEAA